MCDIVPGQLIVCYPWGEPVGDQLIENIKRGVIPHVTYLESVSDRIGKARAPVPQAFEYALHLLEVPDGDEEWKITYLHFFYKQVLFQFLLSRSSNYPNYFPQFHSQSNHQFTVAPNHRLKLVGLGAPGTPAIVDASLFTFSADHAAYKTLLNISGSMSTANTVRVGILDSGIGLNFAGNVVAEHDYTASLNAPAVAGNAPDDNGHGSMVANVIDDAAPGCEFVILKVSNAFGDCAEWDLLAALSTHHACDVLNLSLTFVLVGAVCGNCGRMSHGSRSAVFENILGSVTSTGSKPVVVAAAGNNAQKDLEYPARFGNVLAVGSVDSTKTFSTFSNYGNTAHDGSIHNFHCVAPGGQTGGSEYVGTSPGGTKYYGTSFAAAYATALVARRIAAGASTASALTNLQVNADDLFPGYNASDHGFGLLQA